MKTPDLATFFNPACGFTAQSLAVTLQTLTPVTAMIVIQALKESSIRDQCFEQAAGFRNAQNTLSDALHATKPKRASRPRSNRGALSAARARTSA